MQRSTDRILTTHTGSLPRPTHLLETMSGGRPADEVAGAVRATVADVVAAQVDAGVDVVGDGEMSKESYSTYVRERLSGFEGESTAVIQLADMAEYPDFAQRWVEQWGSKAASVLAPPACVGEIAIKDDTALRADLDNLAAATAGSGAREVFMTAASPGVIAAFFANHHYPGEDDYLVAIAEAMRPEYEAIVDAGFVLQLDCPDLAMCRHLQFRDLSLEQFRETARRHLEVLDHATANIDPERMRMHLCWGNYEGPHHYDVPLRDIIDIVLTARPAGLQLEAANPRHEHEYQVFDDVALPEGKVLIPGVIDSTMNYIEHPEVIAQRLVRYGSRVGRENVMAGSDCGFGTTAVTPYVDAQITWAKFRAMAEGARLATEYLG